jgi:hypothetical protein
MSAREAIISLADMIRAKGITDSQRLHATCPRCGRVDAGTAATFSGWALVWEAERQDEDGVGDYCGPLLVLCPGCLGKDVNE